MNSREMKFEDEIHIEYILRFSSFRLAIYIFFFSLLLRSALTLTFLLRYGFHTTLTPEVWFYFGVSKGSFTLLRFDPTLWILRFSSMVLPEDMLFYAVIFLGSALSSLTSVLIFFLLERLYNKKLGVLAGLIYALMIHPLLSGTAFFTHDTVAIPVSLLALIFGVLLKLERTRKRWIYLFGFLLSAYIGSQINFTIVFALIFIFLLYLYYFGEFILSRMKFSFKRFYLSYFVLLSISLIFLRFTLFSNLLELLSPISQEARGIDLLMQIKANSMDLLPITPFRVWEQYNLLLVFIPFGIYSCYDKRDVSSMLIFLLGVTFSSIFMRGSRLLDIGVAMVVAHAFFSWNRRWNSLMYYLSLALFFFIALYFLLSFEDISSNLYALSTFSVFLFLPIIFLFLALFFLIKSRNPKSSIFVLFTLFGLLYSNLLFDTPQLTEAEYSAFRFLRGRDKGVILVKWDIGFAAEAISQMKPESTPVEITDLYPEVLMRVDEEEVYELISGENIKYIVVTDKEFFRFYNQNIKRYQVIANQFFLDHAKEEFTYTYAEKTLIFRMLYSERNLKYFKKIFSRKDKKAGTVVKVFEVLESYKTTKSYKYRGFHMI
ncbi:MAG: glycosyltransferase family 39 protein [Candidatus Methanofastidiosia archaeon]